MTFKAPRPMLRRLMCERSAFFAIFVCQYGLYYDLEFFVTLADLDAALHFYSKLQSVYVVDVFWLGGWAQPR